jgi:hypothetical protein
MKQMVVIIMAEKDKKDIIPEPPQPRIYIDEFLFNSGLSDMRKGAFRVFVDGKEWMRPDEWQSKLEEFQSK